MKFISAILAMTITTIASAQVISPNGKVEWREKGKGFPWCIMMATMSVKYWI